MLEELVVTIGTKRARSWRGVTSCSSRSGSVAALDERGAFTRFASHASPLTLAYSVAVLCGRSEVDGEPVAASPLNVDNENLLKFKRVRGARRVAHDAAECVVQMGRVCLQGLSPTTTDRVHWSGPNTYSTPVFVLWKARVKERKRE